MASDEADLKLPALYPADPVPVAAVDRRFAAGALDFVNYANSKWREEEKTKILAGERDVRADVQKFARHRLEVLAEARAEMRGLSAIDKPKATDVLTVTQEDRDRLKTLPAYLCEQWTDTLLGAFACHRTDAFNAGMRRAAEIVQGMEQVIAWSPPDGTSILDHTKGNYIFDSLIGIG